ncbi:hypothetical protein THAOC_37729 [Thalassiosira oceanica]|uniref:Uncharacterized protein n=1 Tax=Thalassiosira oceanica TaxID=159749 RepID=K0QY72_THAOC|nr:hypothetical protein THAOC_37729 [Thalassiosira oceanica]|eukprot:EJK43793.1 hypothetical protein THAOC_37729 [Thalassiosira oceanica]
MAFGYLIAGSPFTLPMCLAGDLGSPLQFGCPPGTLDPGDGCPTDRPLQWLPDQSRGALHLLPPSQYAVCSQAGALGPIADLPFTLRTYLEEDLGGAPFGLDVRRECCWWIVRGLSPSCSVLCFVDNLEHMLYDSVLPTPLLTMPPPAARGLSTCRHAAEAARTTGSALTTYDSILKHTDLAKTLVVFEGL